MTTVSKETGSFQSYPKACQILETGSNFSNQKKEAADLDFASQAYLRAYSALQSGHAVLKYKRAGEFLCQLDADFELKDDLPMMSSSDLMNIGLVHKDALGYILTNPSFSDLLDLDSLVALANNSLKAAFLILKNEKFLKRFGQKNIVCNLGEGRYDFINALVVNRIESFEV